MPGTETQDRPSIEALLYQAQKDGVLPITSECGSSCVFCSNRYCPKGCEVFTIGRRSLADIKESIPWLAGAAGPVVIGESVTRINEGEPLTHPDFAAIVTAVREAYPKRDIKVTTNGRLLTHELTDLLSSLRVELTISLNTVSMREEVMGDSDPDRTLGNIAGLKGKVRFDGSIVALPWVTGWNDLRASIGSLKDCGAQTVRVMLPGFSSAHPLYKEMPDGTWDKVKELAAQAARDLDIPVLADPPGLTDTLPRVEFLIKGSPAYRAGVQPGDLIVEVNGRETFSRTDAYHVCRWNENPRVTLDRSGATIGVTLNKRRAEAPGFIVYDDLDKEAYINWERSSQARKGRDVLILTSSFAKPVLEHAILGRGLEARVVGVRSWFFGGNIQAAGLLTVRDFLRAFEHVVDGGYKPVEVTLPRIAFDPWGRDLEGVHYREFARKCGLPLILAG